jgi:hypothetical protein
MIAFRSWSPASRIAQRVGTSLALAVSLHSASLLAAEPKPTEAKPTPADTKASDVKPAAVKLEETKPPEAGTTADTPAPATPPSSESTEPEAGPREPDSDAENEDESPGLDFIKSRRSQEKRAETEAETEAAAAPEADTLPPTRDEKPEPDDGMLGTHQDHWFLALGARVGFIGNEGLDPFSTTDALSQVAIQGGRTLFTDGDVSLALLLEWNYGARTATARGLATDLEVHRISLGAEGRYHLLRRLYGYARLAPGVLHQYAKVAELDTARVAFSADASAGAAVEVFGPKAGMTNRARCWLSFGGGYGFGSETKLTLSPSDGSSTPERTAALSLEPLSLGGPFVVATVSVTY